MLARRALRHLLTLIALSATLPGCTTGEAPNGDGGGGGAPCAVGALPFVAPPSGWLGPASLARSANPGVLPACPAAAGIDLFGGLSAEPATCPCTCEPNAATGCQAPLLGWSKASCSGASTVLTTLGPGCQALAAAGPVSFTAAAASADACVAQGGAPLLPSPRWGEFAVLCPATPQAQQPGCATPPPGFAAELCIYRQAEASCPPSYPVGQQLHAGYQDDRACTGSCTCGLEAMSCGGTVVAHPDPACAEPAGAVSFGPNSCTALPPTQSLDYQPELLGACTPSAPSPTGGVGPALPYTICCDR